MHVFMLKDVITVRDISREDIESVIREALERKKAGPQRLKPELLKPELQGKLLASLFFEESTRTRQSHERAARNLGMDVCGFAGIEGTSVKKGEPFIDTVRMFRNYAASLFVIRHPKEGAPRYAADVLDVPVINAGDGCNSHPTQALLDLMTMTEKLGKIDGIKIALVGDLKNGRTTHSLLQALASFKNISVCLIAPESLCMPSHAVEEFASSASSENIITLAGSLQEVLDKVDVVYVTRIQRERFPEGIEGEIEYQKVTKGYNITRSILEGRKAGIMHPLPRNKHVLEIHFDVDQLPNAWYIQQAENGLYIREVLLRRLLSGSSSGIVGQAKTENGNLRLWQDIPIKDGQKQGEHFLYRLDNGTLIDHIEAGYGHVVLHVLGLQEQMIYARDIRSSRFGRKDVLGFPEKELTENELRLLALVTPRATVNIIRDRRVIRKGKIVLPSIIEGLVVCPNARCITQDDNYERVPRKFAVESQEPLKLRCHYCETPFGREGLKFAS